MSDEHARIEALFPSYVLKFIDSSLALKEGEIQRLRDALNDLVSAIEADTSHVGENYVGDCKICAALRRASAALVIEG